MEQVRNRVNIRLIADPKLCKAVLVCIYAARLGHLRDLAMQHTLMGLIPSQVVLLASNKLDAIL